MCIRDSLYLLTRKGAFEILLEGMAVDEILAIPHPLNRCGNRNSAYQNSRDSFMDRRSSDSRRYSKSVSVQIVRANTNAAISFAAISFCASVIPCSASSRAQSPQ